MTDREALESIAFGYHTKKVDREIARRQLGEPEPQHGIPPAGCTDNRLIFTPENIARINAYVEDLRGTAIMRAVLSFAASCQ